MLKLKSASVELCCPAVSSVIEGEKCIAAISIFMITISFDQVSFAISLAYLRLKSLTSFNIQCIKHTCA